jgi:hypothetical protein
MQDPVKTVDLVVGPEEYTWARRSRLDGSTRCANSTDQR